MRFSNRERLQFSDFVSNGPCRRFAAMNSLAPLESKMPMSADTATNSAEPAAHGLPTPQDRPDADIVLFDGHCRFCLAQVRRLNRLDRQRRLAFMSLHDPEVASRFPDLTHDQLMKEMYVVDQAGGRHAGAGALRYLSRRLLLLWPLAPFLHVPGTMPLWRWLYDQVARRRYWLAGRTQSCEDGACAVHFRR